MGKMVQCRSCGKKFSANDRRCPHCGVRQKKPFYFRLWFFLLVLIGTAFVAFGTFRSFTNYEIIVSDQEQEIVVQASDIDNAFKTNPYIFYNTYFNKTVLFTSRVRNTHPSEEFPEFRAYDFTYDLEGVAPPDDSIRKGDIVTVLGVLKGGCRPDDRHLIIQIISIEKK